MFSSSLSDLMKSTEVDENLSTTSTDILFQRIPTNFKIKDMILNDFLSRQRTDDSNPHEIIPISFDMQAILRDRYYNVGHEKRVDI